MSINSGLNTYDHSPKFEDVDERISGRKRELKGKIRIEITQNSDGI